ncbi:MAG: hypothetical protein NC936_00865 [Candidatus Omnitrophica bacterium]|nr:hypothetical protein [Candidatus Omnitrophota bacterium]
MDKRELYEHLAKIYLDSSKKHQKRQQNKQYLIDSRHLYIVLTVFILVIIPFILIKINTFHRKSDLGLYNTALVIQPDAVKINYNFFAAKKEIYTLPLKGLDLSAYKALAFSLRKMKENSDISLRIELANAFNERAASYVGDISPGWKDYKIDLSVFKNITDWTCAKELLFIAEEWNAKEKNDVIYIENVRFLK